MSILSFPQRLFPQNSITQAELVYQWRSSSRHRRWLRWMWCAVLAASVTIAMILFWGEFAGALLQRDAGPIGEALGAGAIFVVVLTFVWHFSLMFQTLSLAANSIARERQNNTWDVLVLTGVDARQIVRGKWWAIVRHQWRSYALLALLRAGAIIWYIAAESRYSMRMTIGYNFPNIDQLYILLPSPWGILFAGVATAALTMVNLGLTAACGILASTQIRRSALALGRAIALRLLVTLGLALLLILIATGAAWLLNGGYFLGWAAGWLGDIIARCITTLLDNGITIGSQFASTELHSRLYEYSPPYSEATAVAAAIISLAIYILLTRFVLERAKWQAVREKALPPSEMNKEQFRK